MGMHGTNNLVLHEIGHIFNHQNHVTNDPEFFKARKADIKSGKITNPYYLQPDSAGASETFSAAFAV